MAPTFGHGKICYVEIPCDDPERSARFYERLFRWKMRRGPQGERSFDDGVGEVSGRFVRGRPPAREPSMLVHVMVDDVAACAKTAVEEGGDVVRPVGADAPEITAWVRDPFGNALGLYQEPGTPKDEGGARSP